jgi:HSP20 family protein
MTTTITKRQNGNAPATFGNVVDNIFQNSLHRFFDNNFLNVERPLQSTVAPVNVRENAQGYDIEVVAPGCKKEGFSVNINGNLLTIGYEHQQASEKQQEKNEWTRTEYERRSFQRTFTVDDTVNVNAIQARYRDGILHLHLPKNEQAKEVTKTIEIQ